MKKKRKFRKYQDVLIESLKNPKEAAAYLNASLDDGSPEAFLVALRNVAEAYGGMTKLSKKAKLNRISLYRMFSERGNPELYSLNSILNILGLQLCVGVAK